MKGRHPMTYRTSYYRKPQGTRVQGSAAGALVTPRQAAALDRMAAANGFTSGSALLADLASRTVEELGRQPRSVVQTFVDRAFERYGRTGRPVRRGRCEDAPCCGCCD
jgi:hypothetical protein